MNWKNLHIILVLFALNVNAQQDYSRNVLHRGNEVSLRGFKPQIQKGKTCSFYSTSMILEYYGQFISAKQLRRNKNTNGFSTVKSKTTSRFIAQKLESLGFVYITINEKSSLLFSDVVKFSIEHGIPLRWECNLKFSPIRKERKNAGHARIILGYLGREKITHIIYADSWGVQHLHKIIGVNEAFRMTNRFGPIFPRKDNQSYIDDFGILIAKYTKAKNPSTKPVSKDEDEKLDWEE